MNNSSSSQTSDMDRLVALKALREYMYLQNPVSHGMADFIEDVPALRPYSTFAQDAIPSQAVFDHDPRKRHQQIQEALKRIHHLHGDDANLPMESLRGGAAGALGSVPLSFAIGGATRLLTHGKGPMGALRSPAARTELMHGIGEDVGNGVALGAGMGAAAPVITRQVHPKNRALREAADILQENPYLAGLPGGDIVASMNYKKKESKPYQIAKSTAVGAGLGGIAGASAGALNSGMDYLGGVARRKIFRDTSAVPHFKPGKIKLPGLVGAGGGAALGALTSALLPND